MKAKLAEYMDTIFGEAEQREPNNRRLSELKEEMGQNLIEKYEDLVANGKSPAVAYNIAVSSIGDITELLESVCAPSESEKKIEAEPVTPPADRRREAELLRYRNRSAILTSVAIALYILCIVPAILIPYDIGAVLMFLMVAAATAMLIFNSKTKPSFARAQKSAGDDNDDDDDDDSRPRRSPVYKAVSGALWTLTVCVYLGVSFATGYWHITWLIFLIVAALDNIIKAVFDLRR